MLSEGCLAVIEAGAWPVPPVFRAIQEGGGVGDAEMRRTFNMGLGYLIVVAAEEVGQAMASLEASGGSAYEVGAIRSGERGVRYA